MLTNPTRRHFLAQVAGAAAAWALPTDTPKPLRGIFIIMATPFTEAGAVDFEDLENEVRWMDRCAVHGMVWPQLASEYMTLSKEERLRSMEVPFLGIEELEFSIRPVTTLNGTPCYQKNGNG